MLNEKLLLALENCNQDKGAIRKMETLRGQAAAPLQPPRLP